MTNNILTQYPAPGMHMLCFCGDTLEVTLRCSSVVDGKAYLSTNIGNAAIRRAEIIQEAEDRITAGSQDWTNIQMERVDPFTFRVRLALFEEGHFEFKTCIVSSDFPVPQWVPGDNVDLNVEPAAYCCSNTVYCAFTRQFGNNKDLERSGYPGSLSAEDLSKLDKLEYSVIPPSGTFRSLIRELDHIVSRLKCRIIHLLPINPTPTTYARMGRFGSPYASQDFTAIDPALAEFDRKASPLDQFEELVDAVHSRNAKLFLDIAINHTGWASKLQEEHPEWFVRDPDGAYHSPGAWGVTWGDLIELDHGKFDLWKYIANVFLTWCSRGVDGFRCDAGYMIPAPAWKYIVATVRQQYPETIFLLEGLGGDPAVTRNLLNSVNMNWAYSELFQNYSRSQIEGYLKHAWKVSCGDGILIHYAETHDNTRLAAVSTRYARMRTALAALAGSAGAFGFTNGVEWFAKERIDVHEASALNWGAADNQVDVIARLNTILALHPAFHADAMLEILDSGSDRAVMIARSSQHSNDHVIIAVNLDYDRSTQIVWDSSYAPFDAPRMTDLISGKTLNVLVQPHHKRELSLGPGQYVCLTPEASWFTRISKAQKEDFLAQDRIAQQEAAVMVQRLICTKKNSQILTSEDIPALTKQLLRSPEDFLKEVYRYNDGEVPCVRWNWPEALKREVMIPPDHCILVTAPGRFRFQIVDGGRIVYQVNSLKDADGRYFALLPPLPRTDRPHLLEVWIHICFGNKLERSSGAILHLAPDVPDAIIRFNRIQIYNHSRTFLQANGKGAILHQCMELERLSSRYDAILLANLNPTIPEDRHIMWRRIRLWVSYNARLQELKHEHIEEFYIANDGGGVWKYKIPVGNGRFAFLLLKMNLIPGRNAVVVTLKRPAGEASGVRLAPSEQIRILIRPDLEDRNFHTETKAAFGPEKQWPGAIEDNLRGFSFEPAPTRKLTMYATGGHFFRKDEWQYMVYMEKEAQRGLEANGDLYSPGIFYFPLSGDEEAQLLGQIVTASEEKLILPERTSEDTFAPRKSDIRSVMLDSLKAFVVQRGHLKTVIAGYPWFLDWGRDTLIVVRGLIAEPSFRDAVKAILIQFASLEKDGTICNMIAGTDTGNRDTSDAPLWLVIAVRDLCAAEGNNSFLSSPVRDGQTLQDVLESLVKGYYNGTPNGIRCDQESGLIFSPSHFTWMDTNYPAGTPRQGYPVEIQALWIASLQFLEKAAVRPEQTALLHDLAQQALTSFVKYFASPDRPYLSDCLHAEPGITAANAVADDHLRPNQLLAITLGVLKDADLCRKILIHCADLLVPGAIRSLADQPVSYPLPVAGNNGALLNDPSRPYWGRYEGDEDTRRKPAYHNGTAWTWLFPSYCEAYYMLYGTAGRQTAASLLSSMSIQMDSGCIAHLPEILDGDYPHTPRGCDAQAWGMSEYFRVWTLLHPFVTKNAD